MKPATHVPPTVEELKSRFNYDPETGVATYKIDVAYNVAKGRVAGCTRRDGYRSVQINLRTYMLHRIAWALYYGEWPLQFIDHINGSRSDNRINNLRLATTSENNRNASVGSNNTSGYRGVCWDKCAKKWIARVNAKHIGVFDHKDDAIAARDFAARKLHREFYKSITTSAPASLTL